MKKLSFLVTLLAVAVAVPLSIGSSHREAPKLLKDPTADNTDIWAFTASDAPGSRSSPTGSRSPIRPAGPTSTRWTRTPVTT
jgi:Domain of unknown function (DUF4331)